MNKCPRCNLPQNGIIKCQYCGYDFTKYNKRPTKIIQKKFKDIIGAFSNKQILANNKARVTDHSGTRSGSDRRKIKYMRYSPERRSGKDRRKSVDRRGKVARKIL